MKPRALFIPTANSGVTFYRMYNYWVGAHRTGAADFHVLWWRKDLNEMHPWEREIHDPRFMWRITKEMEEWAVQSDAIVVGMLHGPGMKVVGAGAQEYINQSMGLFRALRDMFPDKPILSEIDDNMLSTADYNPAFKMYAPEQELRELAITQFKESDGLIVSTPYLAEVYGHLNENIHVIENCIDFKLWNVQKRKRPGVRIGWAGGANHQEDFRILEDIIPRVKANHPEVTFVFLHGCPPYLRDLPGVEYHPEWARIDKYPKKMASLGFDIGIAPLVDNAFNRGKSNLRWLEYSALGIPTVASNVGHFKQTIVPGVDGLLADTAAEFEAHLEALIRDKSLRRRIGQAAHQRVYRDFNIERTAKRYADVLAATKVNRKEVLA